LTRKKGFAYHLLRSEKTQDLRCGAGPLGVLFGDLSATVGR
jgi:hypothetical protein